MQAPIDTNVIALAHRMADASGEILRRCFRTTLNIESKSDLSPVTMADREVEAALRKLIEMHYPEHGIIGEEFGNVRPQSPWQWVLDPIDGTHAFIAEKATFTTLIALAYEGVPVLGVINQPITNERWLGIAGAVATLNGKPISASDCNALAHATIATTAMKYFNESEAKLFEKLQSQCGNTRFGGDAYLYAKLACGEIDIVMESNLKPYDFCALKTVVEGAGGVITDWQRKSLTIASNGSVIAAGNKALHKAALEVLTSPSPFGRGPG